MTEIEILPPRRPAASESIGQLMAHAQAMSAAKQLAEVLVVSDLVPELYKNNAGNATVAILYGAELGLDPIQSLQQIFVVYGTPAIYARTAVALVKNHGIIVETVSSDNSAVTVKATDSRTGQVEQATWDIARAELAGYTSNKKYKTNPQEMLYAKAAMEVCRKIAPDVLLGVSYSREELDLELQPQRVRSERVGRGVGGLRDALADEPLTDTATESVGPETGHAGDPESKGTADSVAGNMADSTRRKWLNRMFALLGEADCTDRDQQLHAINALTPASDAVYAHRDAMSDDELRGIVTTLNGWDKAGKLAYEVGEIVNAAVIDAAQAAEADNPEESEAQPNE